jgi:hypothetical protein
VLDALEIEQEAHAYLQLGKADHIENAIKFLRARLSAPECVCGEPNTAGVHRQDGPCYQQPERKWQGLTGDDIHQISEKCGLMDAAWQDVMNAVEAKLKEKNT